MPPYVGRFAPSPTGDLHLGTLTAAVAGFIHARQSGGAWLVRIEDIDPPREVPGSANRILHALEALELEWDGDVHYQKTRLEAHLAVARELVAGHAAYHCDCSRRQIRLLTGDTRYPGTCRDRALPAGDTAIRLRVGKEPVAFTDGIQGRVTRDIEARDGDFVIVRRDGLAAYHLAVVLDDAWQGVTDIVRGADLLDSTPLHRCVQRTLGLQTPRYWHIPVITNATGEKLSKSAGAAALDASRPGRAAAGALALLGLEIPRELEGAPPRELWQFAVGHWRIDALAARPGPIAFAPQRPAAGGFAGPCRLFVDIAHAEANAALPVDLEHLDPNDVAFAELVADVLDALLGNLRDMHETVAARQDRDESAEVHQPGDLAFVDLPDFDICRDQLDALLRRAAGRHIDRSDLDGTVVLDIDRGAGLLGDGADDCAALADDVANLLWVDLQRDDARRPV